MYIPVDIIYNIDVHVSFYVKTEQNNPTHTALWTWPQNTIMTPRTRKRTGKEGGVGRREAKDHCCFTMFSLRERRICLPSFYSCMSVNQPGRHILSKKWATWVRFSAVGLGLVAVFIFAPGGKKPTEPWGKETISRLWLVGTLDSDHLRQGVYIYTALASQAASLVIHRPAYRISKQTAVHTSTSHIYIYIY